MNTNPQIDHLGNKYWRNEKGQYHREDGPAIEFANGDKEWRKNGRLHREDGPAYESINGTKYWFKNNLRHREDGPAVEYANGAKHWYLEGKYYLESDFKIEIEKRNQAKMKAETKAPEKPKPGTYRNEKLEPYVKGEPYLEIGVSGNKYWYNEKGQFHREDGPAYIGTRGEKEWRNNGKLHREDGPAVECVSGHKEWYIKGKCYSESEFKAEIEKRNQAKMEVETKSPEKPKPGKYRNEKLEPYVQGEPYFEIGVSGNKYWRNEKGRYHREDGPAIEYASGAKQWHIEGKYYTESDFKAKIKEKKVTEIPIENKDVWCSNSNNPEDDEYYYKTPEEAKAARAVSSDVVSVVVPVISRSMNMFKFVKVVVAMFSLLVAIGSVIEFGHKWIEDAKQTVNGFLWGGAAHTPSEDTEDKNEMTIGGLDQEIKDQESIVIALTNKAKTLNEMTDVEPTGEFAVVVARRAKMIESELDARLAYEKMILAELKRSRELIAASRMIQNMEKSVR